MQESQILQPVGTGSAKPSEGQAGGFTDDNGGKVQRPGKEVKRGPIGKIEPE